MCFPFTLLLNKDHEVIQYYLRGAFVHYRKHNWKAAQYKKPKINTTVLIL